jgi:Flp pilus assembly protein TadG
VTARLLRDEAGATIVEFGMVAPILMLAVMGVFDMAHNIYTSAIMQGAIQKNARDASIEGAVSITATLDARVTAAVRQVMPQANLTFDRKSYSSFTDVKQPEDFTDVDGDGSCDNNEPFEDANGNGTYDTDRGIAGLGGARDAVLYTVTVTYPRAFPLASFAGMPNQVTFTTQTVLRNQPYGAQSSAVVTIGNCT